MSAAEMIVVGGGAVGLSVAVALTERVASATVTVLEQAECGSGATGYAGAIDIPYAHTPLHRELVATSHRWWQQQLGAGPDGPRTALPFAWLVREQAAEQKLREALLLPLGDGGTALAEGAWRLPEGTTALAGAAHLIDPRKLCDLLRARLAASGRGRVLTGRQVDQLLADPDGVEVWTRDGSAWRGDRCVVAVGPWLPGLAESLGFAGAARGVRTKRVYGFRFALAGHVAAHYGVGSVQDGIFFFPVGDGEYAMSLRHDVWNVSPTESTAPEEEVTGRAAVFLDALVGAGNWRLTRTRVFADAYTDDATPRILPHPQSPGRVFAVTGLHGSGVRLAAGLAQLVAKTVWND